MGWRKDNNTTKYHYVMGGVENAAGSNGNTLPSGAESVPVCIIVCRQPSYNIYNDANSVVSAGGWERVFHGETPWKVINARAQIVRYYAASSAKFTLAIDLPTTESRIPPPGLDYTSNRSTLNASYYTIDGVDTTHELRPEMDVEIWMGYIGKLDSVQSYIKNVGSVDRPKYQINPTKFTKVFNGVIDTVDLKMGRGENQVDGVTCVVTARDRMRFLIDNKFFGSLQIPNADFGSTAGVSRTQIIRALIDQGSAKACVPAGDPLFHPSGRPPMVISAIYDQKIDVSPDKTPLLAAGGVPFPIADQFPVDAIRWFSLIETMPRELYCDVETGNIAWTVRMRGEPYATVDGAYLMRQVDTVSLPNNNLNDLWQAIKAANPSKITEGDAVTYMTEIRNGHQSLSDETARKVFDPVTFCCHVMQESSWDPDVETRPSFAAGLCQIVAHERTVPSTGQVIKNPERGHCSEKDARDPKKAFRLSWQILLDKFTTATKRHRSIKQWYEAGFLELDDAQGLAYVAYNGGLQKAAVPADDEGYVLGALDAVIRKAQQAAHGKSVKVTAEQVCDHIVSFRLAQNHAGGRWRVDGIAQIKDHWRKIKGIRNTSKFASFYKGLSASGTIQHHMDVSGRGVAVLRGEDNPWVLSYKRSTKSRSGLQIKPNVLSAHASWSTLGIVTRFTLLNPIVTAGSGAGSGNIRGSHSLFGSRDPSIPAFSMEHVWRTRANLPEAINGKTVSPELTRLTYEVGSRQEKTEVDKEITQMDVSSPIKFASKIRYPVRNRYVWDETSDARMTETVVDLVLNAMLCVHGQDIHAADFLVPLNPDMRPGHIAELHNMGFFDGEQMRIEGVIHMFASGGVHNGCTTMGVAVSTQGSYPPLSIPGVIKRILEIQNTAMDVISEPNATGYFDKVDYDSLDTTPITWERLLKGRWVSQYREALDTLKRLSQVRNPLGVSENVSADYANQTKRVLDFLKQHPITELEKAVSTYAFQHLAAGLGDLRLGPVPRGYGEADGINIKLATSEFTGVLQRYAEFGALATEWVQATRTNRPATFGNPSTFSAEAGVLEASKEAARTLSGAATAPVENLLLDAGFLEDLRTNTTTMSRRSLHGFNPRGFFFRGIDLIRDGVAQRAAQGALRAGDAGALGALAAVQETRTNLTSYKTVDEVMRELKSGVLAHPVDPDNQQAGFGVKSMEDPSQEFLYSHKLYNHLLYNWFIRQWKWVEKTYVGSAHYEANEKVRERIDQVILAIRAQLTSIEQNLNEGIKRFQEEQKEKAAATGRSEVVRKTPSRGEPLKRTK